MSSLMDPKKIYAALETEQLSSVYREQLSRFAKIIRAHGYPVSEFDASLPSKFNELPLERRITIVSSITSSIAHCESAQKDRVPTHDHRQFVWWIIRDLKLRPKSDAFTHIEQEDIIEIYSEDHLQIHRSFNFFKYINYTLDQIFTYEWWELYRRQASLTETMVKTALDFVGGKHWHTELYPFPKHWVHEIFSKAKLATYNEPRLFSTLVDSNGFVRAYINVVRFIDSKPSGDGTF